MTGPRSADPTATGAHSRFAFSDADYAVIARRAYEDFGLNLTPAKKDLVYSRLTKRLRQLGLTDFRPYCALIEAEDSAAERLQMLSALTTNVTQFFREDHHFRILRETVLPPLIATAKAGGRVRLWSAGCSAGQEPYSLAITVLDLFPEAASHDFRILATDVDPVIVARAKAGRYSDEECRSLPASVRERHMLPDGTGGFVMGDRPRALISFAELNLMSEWPLSRPFHFIFCRNVAIYFDRKTQARLWQRFADLLLPGATLCIGHSERISGPATRSLLPTGVTTYRKTEDGAAEPRPITRNGN